MKRTIAIAIGTLALVSCGGTKTIYVTSTEAPETTVKVTKTTDAPIAVAPSWSVEEEFILDIEGNYDNVIYLSDSELIDAGYTTCIALENGMTGYEALEIIVSSADGDPDIESLLTSVVASAVVNFCPEQEYKFEG